MTAKNDSKKTIAVVVYPGITLLDLVGTYSMLVGLTMKGQYKLAVVGAHTDPMASDTPMRFLADKTFDEVPNPEMLFVIGGHSALEELDNQQTLDYLRAAGKTAELVAAVDTGSLLLAAAGLLAGRQATTHWAYRENLEEFDVHYVHQAWVEDGKFITAAGVSGGIDMGLHLIEKRVSVQTALMLQTNAEYDPQPPFGAIDWTRVNGTGADFRSIFAQPPSYSGEKKLIACVLYPGLTPLDLAGPLQVLSALSYFAPQFQTVVVGEAVEPMRADNGLRLLPNRTFDDVPHPYAIVVPGGEMPTLRAMSNPRIREYIRESAQDAEFIASVCTGALILAAVGLLQGHPATTHWAFYKILEQLGSPYLRQRWVENGRIINSAGVSAGIDMALYLASRMTGEDIARRVQLALQYDPQPPLGRIDWDRLSPMLRAMRGVWSLAAPFIALKPRRLLAQGR